MLERPIAQKHRLGARRRESDACPAKTAAETVRLLRQGGKSNIEWQPLDQAARLPLEGECRNGRRAIPDDSHERFGLPSSDNVGEARPARGKRHRPMPVSSKANSVADDELGTRRIAQAAHSHG